MPFGIIGDPVTRLKLSMGPIRGPYSLYQRHVRASMLPKKETKYSYNAFQMTSQNLSTRRAAICSFSIFNMNSPVIFGGP